MKNALPGWAKGIIALALIFIVSFIAYKIYKKIQENKSLMGAGAEIDASKERLKQIPAPTLSSTQIDSFANALEAAFQGYGTDTAAVYNVFSNIGNEADLLKLIAAYGIREISSGSWNPGGNFKGSLSGALTDELSGSDMAKLNSIISGKGINYKF